MGIQNKPTTGKYETREEWEAEVTRMHKNDTKISRIVEVTGSSGHGVIRAFLNKGKRYY